MLPGDVVRVTVWRYDPALGRGRVITHDVQLNRLDEMAAMGAIPTDLHDDGLRRMGLARVATNTRDLASEFGSKYRPGVLVRAVVPGSSLDGKLEPGSVIVAVMDRHVADEDEFFEALARHNLRPGLRLQITYITPGGERRDTHLTIE